MVTGRGSKQKGDQYERDLAQYFNEQCGISSHRTPLSGGGRKEALADLIGTPGIAIEAKRVEKINITEFMAQAVRNCGNDLPVVITRRNKQSMENSYVFMRLHEWMALYRAFLTQQGYGPRPTEETDHERDEPWHESQTP